MRAFLIKLLLQVLRWLQPVVKSAVRQQAETLIRQASQFAPGTSGQYKRDFVFGRLVKAFPDVPHRELSLLIETTLREIL